MTGSNCTSCTAVYLLVNPVERNMSGRAGLLLVPASKFKRLSRQWLQFPLTHSPQHGADSVFGETPGAAYFTLWGMLESVLLATRYLAGSLPLPNCRMTKHPFGIIDRRYGYTHIHCLRATNGRGGGLPDG